MKIIEGGYDDKPISGPWDLPGTGSLSEKSPASLDENDQKDNDEIFGSEIPPQDLSSDYQEYNKQLPPEPGVPKVSDAVKKVSHWGNTDFIQKLLTPEGIYSGLVMAEILGPRKGLRRRR